MKFLLRTFLLALAVSAVAALQAATWTVNASGKVKKLAPVLASAQAGDTVRVLEGIYAEGTITIDKPLTLIGVGRPVIDGTGGDGNVIIVTASDVTVQGFLIRGTKV
ncbi:MAG: nitrous oxide reductase family maturation protein NosD, partial [Flavobacteriales bacterium]